MPSPDITTIHERDISYVVGKARDYSDPDLVGTNRQVRIRSDEEMVEQAHVGHCLLPLDARVMTVCLKITYKGARRRT